MIMHRLRSGRPRRGLRRAGWALAGLVLLGQLAGSDPAAGAGDVIARLGSITVSATALRPGPAGALTSSVRVTTSGQSSDQLDAAIAAGGGTVAVYHRQVNVGEIPDSASCGGDIPRRAWWTNGSTMGRFWSPAAPAPRPRPRTRP